ncbi:MAG: TatD family hydrolase [Erysipelotrichaceae bacterium]|nr:TatD family hydrolase [Erysipelotrichaceae bacterium]
MSYWIDTHCHMNEEVYCEDFDGYMKLAGANNVRVSNIVCLNREDFEYTKQLKERYPNLDITFGYFPEDVHHLNDGDMDYLESVVDEIIAVGEIGLDYYWNKEEKEKQKEMFICQIEVANRHNKPIMIHSRSAARDTYEILKQYARTKVIMHCFSESTEMMRQYLKLGYYISFPGVVTFKNAREPKENALECPLNRMMIETDCPYLTPVPFRGQRNQTAYVRYTGEYIAQLRGISVEELQDQLIRNYEEWKAQ